MSALHTKTWPTWAVPLALLLLAYGLVPLLGTAYLFDAILIPFLALSLAAVGLNLLTGYAGQLSLGSAAFMAFNHGLNDGQKFMGVFAMTLLAGKAIDKFAISWWVIVACALTMGLGTSFGGWRIIQTVGSKMTRLTSWQGFAATMAASTTIAVASSYGLPGREVERVQIPGR